MGAAQPWDGADEARLFLPIFDDLRCDVADADLRGDGFGVGGEEVAYGVDIGTQQTARRLGANGGRFNDIVVQREIKLLAAGRFRFGGGWRGVSCPLAAAAVPPAAVVAIEGGG